MDKWGLQLQCTVYNLITYQLMLISSGNKSNVEIPITTEYLGRTYRHGTVSIEKKDEIEADVEVFINFAFSRSNKDQLIADINTLVQKYAI